MLESLVMITLACFHCGAHEEAYREELGYTTVQRGQVSAAMAQAWNADVEGHDYFIMQAASGAPVYLRFIHNEAARDFEPMGRLGWNAIEILVENADELAQALDRSEPFDILAPPAYLTEQRNIRAFQATGPGGELLYLTQIFDPARTLFNLGPAQARVDQPFILVLGTRNLDRSRSFYRDHLGLTTTQGLPYRVEVLSNAYNLPSDTTHMIALAGIRDKFAIELDQYPEKAAELVRDPGTAERENGHKKPPLPAGVAMVTLVVEGSDNLIGLEALGAPITYQLPPFAGRQAITIRGPDGELIELLEAASDQGNVPQALRSTH